jgi:hypothetical protein
MRAALFRTVLMLALAAAAGGGLWWHQQRHSATAQLAALAAEKAVLQDLVQRLGNERRMAEMVVTEQHRGDDGVLVTSLLFAEMDAQGEPLPPKRFTVRGETVHILAHVVKFDQAYLEAGDELRGHSVALFTGIHGGAESPEDAQPIDVPDQRPTIYADADRPMAAFEQELWATFWQLARDDALRQEWGVRVAHGEGPWSVFEPNHIYTLTLEADGGLNLASRPVPGIFRALADLPTD